MTTKKRAFKPEAVKIKLAIDQRHDGHAVMIPPDIHDPALDMTRHKRLVDTWNDHLPPMHEVREFEPKV